MRAVVQRVSRADVHVGDELVGAIGVGLLVLLGVGRGDDLDQAHVVADKIAALRIFPDGAGRMHQSVRDVGGGVLVVSQFTLYGDVRRGNRPSFTTAAAPEDAEPLVEVVVRRLRDVGLDVAEGRFGATMAVTSTNDGPITIVLDTAVG
ncbi:D-aminoacyl-tRNA deacylase [soil metagenome]|nr:D-tyrosyl-tRNA(Tyr) deacylase [Trueperaceae bacterium]